MTVSQTSKQEVVTLIIGNDNPSSNLLLSLKQLSKKLKELAPHQVTLNEFKTLVIENVLELSREFINSNPSIDWIDHQEGYKWAEFFQTPELEVILLDLPFGIYTRKHNHKHSALNVGIVLAGILTSRLFEDDTQSYQDEFVNAGNISWTEREQYHQLGNDSQEAAIVLSLYTPSRE